MRKLCHLLFQLRPFKIISVKNTETNASLSERDAIKQGVLDDNRITYTDKTTGKQVLIADAIQVKIFNLTCLRHFTVAMKKMTAQVSA